MQGKEQEAGAQMFAHGLSEIYVAMEEVFKTLGVTVSARSWKPPLPQQPKRNLWRR